MDGDPNQFMTVIEGGYLDLDNIPGGPGSIENVFFDASAPTGDYEYYIEEGHK